MHNKSLYMKAMNYVRNGCDKCPSREASGTCPGGLNLDFQEPKSPDLRNCARHMYEHLLKKKKTK